MNKARLLLLILGLSLLSGSVCMHPATLRIAEVDGNVCYRIPSDYYFHASVIPVRVDPYEWLTNLEWADEYKTDEWDCSNMAAYLEWVLENAGIPTRIHAGYGHAWLLIWRSDKQEWWAYECTGLHWINPWAGGAYYRPELVWDNIYDVQQWHHPFLRHFAWEWCWWTEYFDPWLEVR